VISARVEEIPPIGAQTMSARALAPLTDLLAHASRHLQPTGQAIFPKGRGYQAEIQAAQQDWSFDCTQIQSKTDTESAILIIKNIAKR
jgi:16S rRNA (guanine527-N7)-methyltransferase